MPWAYEPDTPVALERIRRSGYQIAIAETAPDATDLFAWEPTWPLCVVFGHEVTGVRPAVGWDGVIYVRVPMFGAKTSLNVATAGGVVLYELLRKRLAGGR